MYLKITAKQAELLLKATDKLEYNQLSVEEAEMLNDLVFDLDRIKRTHDPVLEEVSKELLDEADKAFGDQHER